MSDSINLTNIGGGAAAELFEEEWQKLIANVLDPNTEAKAKRELTLRFIVKPVKDRSFGTIELHASAKLASPVAYSTRAYFGQQGKEFTSYEDNPNQLSFTDFVERENQATPIESAAKKEDVK